MRAIFPPRLFIEVITDYNAEVNILLSDSHAFPPKHLMLFSYLSGDQEIPEAPAWGRATIEGTSREKGIKKPGATREHHGTFLSPHLSRESEGPHASHKSACSPEKEGLEVFPL